MVEQAEAYPQALSFQLDFFTFIACYPVCFSMMLPYLLSMEGKDEEGIQYVCHHWGEGWATSCWRSHHWSMRLTYETNCAHQHALILVRLVNNSKVCFRSLFFSTRQKPFYDRDDIDKKKEPKIRKLVIHCLQYLSCSNKRSSHNIFQCGNTGNTLQDLTCLSDMGIFIVW